MCDITAHWLAKGKALKDVLHNLFLSSHRDHARQHELKVNTMVFHVLIRLASTALAKLVVFEQIGKCIAEVRFPAILDTGLQVVTVCILVVWGPHGVLSLRLRRVTAFGVHHELLGVVEDGFSRTASAPG